MEPYGSKWFSERQVVYLACKLQEDSIYVTELHFVSLLVQVIR